MMRESDRATVAAFADRLRVLFPDARVWAFGSRTRGDAAEDSDLDICVVLDHVDAEVRRAVSHTAWEVGFERDVVVTTVVFSKEMFERGPASASPLVKTIRREGVAA